GRPSFDRKLQRKLVEKALVDELDCGNCGEQFGRPARARVVDRSELPQAFLTKKSEVGSECEGAQDRARADVRRRLLAADVLLARRQGEDEAALACRIHRLAREPAWHLPDMLLTAGEQADI